MKRILAVQKHQRHFHPLHPLPLHRLHPLYQEVKNQTDVLLLIHLIQHLSLLHPHLHPLPSQVRVIVPLHLPLPRPFHLV